MKQSSDSDSIGCIIGLLGLYRTLVFIASGLKNVVVTALRPPQGTGYEFGANPHRSEDCELVQISLLGKKIILKCH